MAKTIEQRAARTILETDEETIEIGGKQYTYGKPTLATIIMVSELVSQLPTFPTEVDSSGVVHAVLQGAKDERVIGKILAGSVIHLVYNILCTTSCAQPRQEGNVKWIKSVEGRFKCNIDAYLS